jgi:hypothetical protein
MVWNTPDPKMGDLRARVVFAWFPTSGAHKTVWLDYAIIWEYYYPSWRNSNWIRLAVQRLKTLDGDQFEAKKADLQKFVREEISKWPSQDMIRTKNGSIVTTHKIDFADKTS